MRKQLRQLQAAMKAGGYDMYIVRDGDDHSSEYVAECYHEMSFVSGFTGGDGILLVTGTKGYLWTDGRYFIQAAGQLAGSGIELMKMDQPGVPTIGAFIAKRLKKGQTLGVCASLINTAQALKLQQICRQAGGRFKAGRDLVAPLWTDRPAAPNGRVFLLEEKYAGASVKNKVSRLRRALKEKQVDALLLSSLDDIGWLYNFRGDDIPYWPVCIAYGLITMTDCYLFFDVKKADAEILRQLASQKIEVKPYGDLLKVCRQLKANTAVQCDFKKLNYKIYKGLNRLKLIDDTDPTVIMKAVKNDIEIANLKQANIYDGLAVTRLMYWLQHDSSPKTELSVSEKLLSLRRQQPAYIEDSFSTIAAFNENGAMMHYNPATGNNAAITEGLLLIDSGGQYYLGTTDITRTFVIGTISQPMKDDFTRALKAHIDLAKVCFLEGIHGYNLDILARGPLWQAGMDYKCGTGHGVGYLSNVHEGPQGFRYKIVPERTDNAAFQVNMVTTIEPGVYREGQYGIRHENDVVCVDAQTTPDGHFLAFEPLTLCPFDVRGIDRQALDRAEIDYLNDYHRLVYEKLSPLMTAAEAGWLKEITAAL